MISNAFHGQARPRLVVVIPALNAADRLPACLSSLQEGRRAGLVRAIVLADGGSEDGTLQAASAAGCAVLHTAPGRGGQIAAGVEAARALARPGDWLLLLHADTSPEPGWACAVGSVISQTPEMARAFHFRFALDDVNPAARRLERQVNWRSHALGLPYGDQGLLISFSLLDALGGFRPWPLFEDVDIVRRIGRRRLAGLPVRAVTSAERFQREGYLGRSARNLVLLSRYFLGARPDALARAYRRKG